MVCRCRTAWSSVCAFTVTFSHASWRPAASYRAWFTLFDTYLTVVELERGTLEDRYKNALLYQHLGRASTRLRVSLGPSAFTPTLSPLFPAL